MTTIVEKTSATIRNFPLRVQLMLVFAVLSVATTIVTAVALASIERQRTRTDLSVKSAHYAKQLQQQLQAILDPGSRLSARGLFESLSGDRDVNGLAVYLEDGELIEGRGDFPRALESTPEPAASTDKHIVTVTPIELNGNVRARLYVSLSTTSLDDVQREELWAAGGIAAAVVLSALLLANRISGKMARRLEMIAHAAKRLAAGAESHVELDSSSRDEIGSLAQAFNTMVSEQRKLSAENERLVSTERERLERLVTERTEALEQSREMFRLIAESTQAIPFKLDLTDGSFPYIGPQAGEASGVPVDRLREPRALDLLIPREHNPDIRRHIDECADGAFEWEAIYARADGQRFEVRWAGTCEIRTGSKILRGLMSDVTEMRRMQRELAGAQKLESVGRLAAGVAHEINTPLQFVADNVEFIRNSLKDLGDVFGAYRELQSAVESGRDAPLAAQKARAAEEDAQLDYLMENVPSAAEESMDGLRRITDIVRSMKEFAHPDQRHKVSADLNKAIKSAIVIAHNEYKYVADMTTEFGEIPPVECHLGEINQVILNLIVNAAHAIGDATRKTGGKGRITVRTREVGAQVEIAIEDTGGGIPESVRDRIFDPFFTTKEIGKGTGQGLAIARSIIVNKHAGSLRFETVTGQGTTFFIRLPIVSAVDQTDAADLAEVAA